MHSNQRKTKHGRVRPQGGIMKRLVSDYYKYKAKRPEADLEKSS